MEKLKHWGLLLGLVVAVSLLWWLWGDRPLPPVEIRGLFLGDEGHHKPAERFAQLEPVLRRHGIELVYTGSLDDLNPDNLSRYDLLLIYANHREISPEQEAALLDFVARGGGFVPIHCASYCFLNSPEYIRLVGAQFQSHGTGVFRAAVTDPTHPIMEGFQEFETWDETYVHTHHNPDRHLLMVREEAGHQEPWTWVRTHGQGRVFYTAYGHDERTWSHPGFHDLVERGIRWVTRAGEAAAESTPPGPFRYTEATIPYYAPDQPGTSVQPLNQMQLPLSPQESMRQMRVPSGFQVELFAAEPDVVNPVALAWDEQGRLWVAETLDYPNQKQPLGQGNDRIKICEDTDGDGRADRFTVFAEHLSIPTGLVFASGGVIVAQPPELLFLKDTDGDDRADERRVLFTGFGDWDTHASASNLRWGFDNWIWGTLGYSGFKGMVGRQYHEFRQGIYRFRPDGSKLEFLASTSNNTWGLGFTEEGFVFVSTANNQHSVHMAIPNRYYERVYGWSPGVLAGISDHWRFHPLKEVVRQVDWHGGFTAAAGHSFYTARSYPPPYWNRVAFVAEPTGSLLHKCVIRPQGSHFVSHDAANLLASYDEWTAPIAAEVGPDGAVWVLDWYNYIIQHNPTPHGFQTGKGNAYEIPLRDRQHGRIYRIVHSASPPSPAPNLKQASARQLVQALRHDNQLWRLHAQRLLVERGDTGVASELVRLVEDRTVDPVGLNVGAIHALWTLHGLGLLDGSHPQALEAALEALDHPSSAVRKTALEVLPATAEVRDRLLASGVLQDPQLRVRLAALLALCETDPSEEAGEALYRMLSDPENLQDRWIPDGLTVAAARHKLGFLRSLSQGLSVEGEEGESPRENRMVNASLEEGSPDSPPAWGYRRLQGEARHGVADLGRTGNRSLWIASARGAAARWSSMVEVQPHTDYRVSGWIRTENLERNSGVGARLEVYGLEEEVATQSVAGTTDWTRVEATFNSGPRTRLGVGAVFGGEGSSQGQAWFDDLELVEIGNAVQTRTAQILRRVAQDYAREAPTETVLPVLKGLRNLPLALTLPLLEGLAAGWPRGATPRLEEADRAELSLLMQQFSPEMRGPLLLLADRWGQRQVFSADVPAALERLRRQVQDPSLDAASRAQAASRLIRLDENPGSVELILAQVSPRTSLTLTRGLLASLGEGSSPAVAAGLIRRWEQLTPLARETAVQVLLRRAYWTRSLLEAIEQGKVDHRELNAEQMQQLTLHVDEEIVRRARRLAERAGRTFSPDRAAVVERFWAAASRRGDPRHGEQVFENNCRRCHSFQRRGGIIGPDLTGVGSRSRADILVDILDPNRSVEGKYRLWMVTTRDGEVLTGRLESETQTTVELLDSSGQRHAVPRQNIAQIRASQLSIMPEGLEEEMSLHDLSSLLEYLAGP